VTAEAVPPGEAGVEILSPVRGLFCRQQDEAVTAALAGWQGPPVRIRVEDSQALDFVITARVTAALEALKTALQAAGEGK